MSSLQRDRYLCRAQRRDGCSLRFSPAPFATVHAGRPFPLPHCRCGRMTPGPPEQLLMVLETVFGSYGSGFGSAVVVMVAVVVSGGGGSGCRGRRGRRCACRDAEFGDMSEAGQMDRREGVDLSPHSARRTGSGNPWEYEVGQCWMEATSLTLVFFYADAYLLNTASSTWVSLEYQNLRGLPNRSGRRARKPQL